MKLIIRNAKIIDSGSDFHNKVADILIEDGVVSEISESIFVDGATQISFDNLHVSKGWIDSSVCFGEPGFEDSETIANGLNVAAKSGFTGIMLQPNTFPTIDNQALINFVQQKSQGFATELFAVGSITKNMAGTDLAELFDMKKSGAVAFSDFKKTIANPLLMKIAMQYVQDFDGKLIAFANDKNLQGKGVVNEGKVSTQLGLKGIPAIAESSVVANLLQILNDVGGSPHIAMISTTESVNLIREAKAKGFNVTCSVSVNNLVLTDETLMNFETKFKLMPPLRTDADRKSLIAAVIDGTIDAITSDHVPIDIERKKMEFDRADYGSIGLESCFGALGNILPFDVIVQKLTAARALFGLKSDDIRVTSEANFTFFDPGYKWKFNESDIYSRSKNSAMLSKNMKGKVYGICRGNKLVLNNE